MVNKATFLAFGWLCIHLQRLKAIFAEICTRCSECVWLFKFKSQGEVMFICSTRVRYGFCGHALIIIALATVCVSVSAEEKREWSLDVNGLSSHSESRYFENGVSKAYNETNPGLGVSIELHEWREAVRRYESTQWVDDFGVDLDFKVGFFDNSYKKTSIYVGPFFHKDLGEGSWAFAPGLALLLISGYDDTPEDAPAVAPLPIFALEVGHRAMKLNFGYMPWGRVDLVTMQLQIVPAYW